MNEKRQKYLESLGIAVNADAILYKGNEVSMRALVEMVIEQTRIDQRNETNRTKAILKLALDQGFITSSTFDSTRYY